MTHPFGAMPDEPDPTAGAGATPGETPDEAPAGRPPGVNDEDVVRDDPPGAPAAADSADASVADDAVGVDGAPTEEPDELTRATTELAERTADLQRVQAEFRNYKRRVDRDRELVAENARYTALTPIVDVLDTIDRAREHGPLEDGLRAVADQLERVVAAQGLVRFGEVGEAFDPTLHEALTHLGEDPEVEVTTCKVITRAGYRIGDRVVRAAQVLVVDPAGS